jgi:hypothetical protein
MKKPINEKVKKFFKIFFEILRAFIYIGAVFSAIFYFFNIASIIVGVLYFIIFRRIWRVHGLVLALSAAMASFFNHFIGSKIEFYPLFFVVTMAWSILGTYFALLAFLKIRSMVKKVSFNGFFNLKENKAWMKLSPFVRFMLLSATILTPTMMWGGVSVNFNVLCNNKTILLWVHAPSTTDVSEEFDLSVQAWDSFERLSATYKGTVSFTLESYDLTTLNILSSVDAYLPSDYTFTGRNRPSSMSYKLKDGRDNGKHVFTATINTPGIHYILVNDSHTNNIYYSNPIIVQNSPTQIYWGDMHSHSIISDGSGTASHAYYYARYVANLDFHSLTEHGEIVSLRDAVIERYKYQTDLAYAINEFVTFYGIEYTSHDSGHYSCIFDGTAYPENPLISSREASLETPYELWNYLDEFTNNTGIRVLALPHHTVKLRYLQDWSYLNPKYVRIAEVTSVHGDSLYEPYHPLSYRGISVPPPVSINGSSITDALKMGHMISLYAASDTHDGHPGHTLSHTKATIPHQRPWTYWWTRNDKKYPGGITAVYANELTRENIFTNLYDRRIFASSDFGRPILNFTINDVGIGGESILVVDNSTVARDIQIFIAQDGAPSSSLNSPTTVSSNWIPNWNADVEILKNGELLTTIPITTPIARLNFTDTSVITGAVYGEQSCVNIDGKYYLNEYSNNPIADPSTLTTGGVDFYIIRVIGQNGRFSYIGPIWVQSL